MPVKKLIPAVALGLAAALWAGTAPPAGAGEKTGTSVSDQAVAYAQFSIDNPTADPISYRVKWGNGEWKPVKILPGETYEHSYKLNARGEFFTPSIRFDYILNDGQATPKVYDLRPSRVVRGGFGPGGNTGTPKAYYFKVSADRRFLELHQK
jgi:hypothetical protein